MPDVKYNKAVKRLEEIMQRIEGEEIDVDELGNSVKEAVDLIKACKNKIEKAEMQVKQIVEGFEEKDDE